MSIRVIKWATGTVGIHAVPAIMEHPDLELAALWVYSDEKSGQDAGTLCGTHPAGVVATQDRDAVLNTEAEVICYTGSSDVRPGEVVDDIEEMLRRGFNVVNTSFVPLLHPRAAGEEINRRLNAACQEGGSTLFTSGIDPGFGNAGLAIHALALCKEVRSVRMMEIVNYATWNNPFTMFEIMGFGKSDPSQSLLLSPGSTAMAWGPVVQLVADAIQLPIDEIVERHEVEYAEEDFEISSGPVSAGGITAMRFEIIGKLDGEERVIVEHVTRLRDSDAPSWPQGKGYRIEISGEPNALVELSLSSDHGDHNHAGCLATAMHVVNAIPTVARAEPGILTLADIPVFSANAG